MISKPLHVTGTPVAVDRWRGPGAAVAGSGGIVTETNASAAGRGKGFSIGRGRGMKGKYFVLCAFFLDCHLNLYSV